MTSIRFGGAWSPTLVLGVALALSLIGFWSYRRRLAQAGFDRMTWTLPCLRAAAILLVGMTLAEPTFESQTLEGELAKVTFLLDASRSMSVDTSPTKTWTNNYARATEALVAERGLLSELKDKFEIEVARFDSQSLTSLWNSSLSPTAPPEAYQAWRPEDWSQQSAIGDALRHVLTREGNTHAGDILVLLSDGQNNSGTSPKEVAQELKKLDAKVFTIGFGPVRDFSDLALRNLTTPNRVYRTDTLQGTALVEQHLSTGQTFSLQIEHEGETVWQRSFVANEERLRKLEFTMPVLDLLDSATAKLPAGAKAANLPVKLTAKLSVAGGETNEHNNSQVCHFDIASQQSRVLLLDGRSRWESRYLKNMFARDPAWQIDDALQLTTTRQLPFVKSQEDVFQYDLIVIGDVEAFSLPSEMPEWIRKFVEQAGGGLIVIDGARQNLRGQSFAALHSLLPVTWLGARTHEPPTVRDRLPKLAQLTSYGRSLAALQLSAQDTAERQDVWSRLAPLEYVAKVEPLPGAEVLLEASSQVDRFPLLITRRYGAGRVLFSASDETWRWRYQSADTLHSRLWLQLSRWVMKSPMSLTGEFVSLDTGSGKYTLGQPIHIRCQLRGVDGQVATGVSPTTVVTSNGQVVARIPMQEEAIAGTYVAQTRSFPAGDYEVQIAAPGFSSTSLELKAAFSVELPPDEELQRLSCNRELLNSVSERTGGKYLDESQVDLLPELLQPLRRGKIRSGTFLLWQSYGWFAAAMLLLIAEWTIRKRVGLV